MPIQVLMPALSPTMEKGNLAKWLKKEGEAIKSGDVIAEIETDKATMEVEATDEGTLGKILIPEGTADVAVNTPIATILADGESAADLGKTPDKTPDKAADKTPAPPAPDVAQEVAESRAPVGEGKPMISAPQAPAAPKALAEPDPDQVVSHIKEIHELGSTVHLAQRAISSFARFVPKEIVRRVVDNSISTTLGGIKQEITLVFTDVQGFTTIAEAADPDVLMRQTSRYFSALTEAFLAEGGTVDKFIGDAVMVFWNAPDPQPDHVARACRAALSAKAAGERLNAAFEAEGLTPFFTRFGIHVGEAVVGNVGSTERMNYTALGNTVNLAARLEGLNKQVGTAILASEDVYMRVRDQFKFRALDAVVAKGMSKETRIFELVGALA